MRRVGYIRLGQFKPRVDNEGIHCLNCDAVLTGRRRRYCSDKCTHEFWTKHNWGLLRQKMIIHSKFTCAKCGYHIEVEKDPSGRFESKYWDVVSEFIVDHIVPIFEGGEEFDEANLQVLCKECNKKKTKSDMKRYWRQQKIGMLGDWWTAFWDFTLRQRQIDEWMKLYDTQPTLVLYDVDLLNVTSQRSKT